MKDILLGILMSLDGKAMFGSLLDAIVPANEFAKFPSHGEALSADDDDSDEDDDADDDDSDEDSDDGDSDDGDSDDDDSDDSDDCDADDDEEKGEVGGQIGK